MGNYQKFLKNEIPALAERRPDLSAKERLQMARKTCGAQTSTQQHIVESWTKSTKPLFHHLLFV